MFMMQKKLLILTSVVSYKIRGFIQNRDIVNIKGNIDFRIVFMKYSDHVVKFKAMIYDVIIKNTDT